MLPIILIIIHFVTLWTRSISADAISRREHTSPLRDVVVTVKTRASQPGFVDDNNEYVFPMHSYLEFGGSDLDGIMIVHLAVDGEVEDDDPESRGYHLRLRELRIGEDLRSRDEGADVTVQRFVIGQTRYRNKEIFDPDQVTGAAIKDWDASKEYRIGKAFARSVNNCQNIIQRILTNMNMVMPAELGTLFSKSEKFYGSSHSQQLQCTMSTAMHFSPVADPSDNWSLVERIVALGTACLPSSGLSRRQGTCSRTLRRTQSCGAHKAWWVDLDGLRALKCRLNVRQTIHFTASHADDR